MEENMLTVVKNEYPDLRPLTKSRILIVDDELPILLVLKRALRHQYAVSVAMNARHALELLVAEGPFAVVVADMRMPGESGVEFLAKAHEIAPATSRIMLTGDQERETALAAMNDGHVFRFLEKPCPASIVAEAIAKGVQQYEASVAAENQASHALGEFQADLLCPLRHILGYAKLIEEGVISVTTMREYARQIRESAHSVIATSETIRDLVAIRERRYVMEPAAVEIGALVRAAVKPHARLAAAKGVRLDLDLVSDRMSVTVDPKLMARAIEALLSNAIKFSSLDGAVVIRAEPAGECGSHVCITVHDSGCGIPEETAQSLLNRRPIDASGLGLPMTMGVAELHGGYVEIENRNTMGVEARLVFPIHGPENRSA